MRVMDLTERIEKEIPREQIDVVQTHGTLAVGGIQFHDNLVGQAADSRSDTAGSRQVDFTVGSNFTCLDDSNIHFSHETIAYFLRHL